MDGKIILFSSVSALALVLMPELASAQATGDAGAGPAALQDTVSQSAGSGLEEIIVTARRREEKLQDVPQAISVLTSTELRTQQVRDQNDLQQKVPSLSIAGRFGATNGNYAIRGLSGPLTSGQPSVGTYFAEVPTPISASGGDLSAGQTLYDLASVQVLKGPQGTLFGRTTTAGAVLVTPAAPNLTDWEGNASLSIGSLDYASGTAAVSIPVIRDVLAVRIAGNFNHRRGYTKNLTTNQYLDELNNNSQRVSVLFKPVSWLTNTFIYDRFHSDQAAGSYLLIDAVTTVPNLNIPGAGFAAACGGAVGAGLSPSVAACQAERTGLLASIRAGLLAEEARTAAGGNALRQVNAGNSSSFRELTNHETIVNTTILDLPKFDGIDLQIKNIFGYQLTKGYFNLNVGAIPQDFVLLNFGTDASAAFNQVGNTPTRALGKGNKFYTEEVQLSGTLFDRLKFAAGYFYQNAPLTQDLENLGGVQKQLGGVTTLNLGYAATNGFQVSGGAKQTAWYAQGTLGFDGLIDGLSFTAGYRRTSDEVTRSERAAVLNPASGVFTPGAAVTTTQNSSKGVNYIFSLDYKVTPGLLVYVTHRKGYTPGGINALGSPILVYGPESIKDVEAGLKWDFDLGQTRGRLNVAAYQIDYSNIQRPRTENVGGRFLAFTDNVAKARLRGFEVELTVLPTDNLRVGVNYSLNDAKYKEWIGADPYGALLPGETVGQINLTDNDFANAPKHKLNVNATLDIPLSGDNGVVAVTGQVTYQSRNWYATANKRYLLVNPTIAPDTISQAGYAVVGGRIDWRDPLGHQGITASLFARNLFNKLYAYSATQISSIGLNTKQFAEPRIVGASLSMDF